MSSALDAPKTPDSCSIRRSSSRSRLLQPSRASSPAAAAAAVPHAGPPASVPPAAAPAAWASLPRDLLAHIFHLAADSVEQRSGEDGVGLAEAAAMMAAFSPCRWWRAVALEEACLPLRADTPEQLQCPLLSSLRCRQLSLPLETFGDCRPSCTLDCATWDACSLLSSPAFRQRSSGCLAALLRVPAGELGRRVLACCSLFPSLRRLSLSDCPAAHWRGWQAMLGVPFPSNLQVLEVPMDFFWSCPARVAGWQPPASLQRLVRRSQNDLTVGFTTLCPCPEHVAEAARTATVHIAALHSASGCRRLEVAARWVVLSSPDPQHVQALLGLDWHSPLQPVYLDAVLEAWLAVLATSLAGSSIACMELTTTELSLYSQACGRMAKLPLPRWQQPGEQRVTAHGLEARLRWPVPGQGPARFTLTVQKMAA